MSVGYRILARLDDERTPQYYWTVENSKVVLKSSSPSQVDTNWGVRGGLIFYGKDQVFYNVQTAELTVAPLISSNKYAAVMFTPCNEQACQGYKWRITVSSNFPPGDQTTPPYLGVFDTSVAQNGKLVTYNFGLGARQNGSLYVPTGVYLGFGFDKQKTDIYTLENTIVDNAGNSIPLTGISTIPNLGTIQKGTTVEVNTGQAVAATGFSFISIMIVVIILIVIIIVVYYFVAASPTKKTNEVSPYLPYLLV